MIIIAFITLLNVSSNTGFFILQPSTSDIIREMTAFIIEFIRRTNSLFPEVACFISQMCSFLLTSGGKRERRIELITEGF